MADQNKLAAEVRTEFGKGFARRLRAAGKIPAVIYGHGTEPVHVALPGHETALIVRHANALLELDVEGRAELALVKDVQRDPVRQVIEHIDLLVVKKGEKVAVEVPVTTVGESFSGTIVNLETATLKLEVEATHIPEHVEVSVEGLEDGTVITAGDIALPQGAVLADEPELQILSILTPRATVEDEAAAEGEEAPAAE
ncbi:MULTISPECIES: 50S ribosomal protein L25/general stress protein Ctc [Microbacterium]|uniref:Large ribosomal subunit protein bL25 n=1 Tax=Microbacterium barkeri TaxID=33917 RepID=A0A9W6LX68_9MICO|nr:50S ribosomal protein L25/general stress protein Ctc [Microbacterium barkeri]MDI6944102.1 50S ribosomal protein L25/general stress protein Ctc [Microbacterium barkeri]MDR6876484.1 large subunit ribosomal protein L25 [Microbacterium barkeri]GLJ62111.1 50S ribosomal protein L25 [Microbacterium barkeri]